MGKTYSFPGSGIIRTRLRLDWPQFRSRITDWVKQSRRGIVQGAALGLFVAICYSLFIFLQVVARRSFWFPSVQVTAWQIVASYFAAFVSAGALVGALAPALRWRLGGVLAGMLAGVLVYGITQLVVYGLASGWLTASLQPGLGLGGAMGYLLHYQLVPERRWPQYREVVSVIMLGVVLVALELLIG